MIFPSTVSARSFPFVAGLFLAVSGPTSCTRDPGSFTPWAPSSTPPAAIPPAALSCHDSGIIAARFVSDWVRQSGTDADQIQHLSADARIAPELRQAHHSLLDSARRADPELGLGFDPILDAQDNPESGFHPVAVDSEGYVRVEGPGGFSVTVRLEPREGHCRITGAGCLRIPATKRALRP